jgi:aquaporin Z
LDLKFAPGPTPHTGELQIQHPRRPVGNNGTVTIRVRARGAADARERRKPMSLSQKLAAEFIGTLWLVLGGCGAAVLAAAYPALGSASWGSPWPSA